MMSYVHGRLWRLGRRVRLQLHEVSRRGDQMLAHSVAEKIMKE
jgi:hypothetical protein